MEYAIAALVALALGFAAYRSCIGAFSDGDAAAAEKDRRAARRSERRRAGGGVGAVSAWINRVLPVGKSDTDDYRNKLVAAGVRMEPETWHGVTVVSVAACTLFGVALLMGSDGGAVAVVLYVGLGVSAGWGLPRLYLAQKTRRRRKEIGEDLPDAIALLAIAVQAGSSLEAAIKQVAKSFYGPVAEEFARVDRDVNMLNIGKAEALKRMAGRCQSQPVSVFCSAIVQADKQGAALTRVLQGQADNARRIWNDELKAKANKIPTYVTFPLVLCFVPCGMVLVGIPLLGSSLQFVLSLGGAL